jgi:hypothetical protein
LLDLLCWQSEFASALRRLHLCAYCSPSFLSSQLGQLPNGKLDDCFGRE